MPLAYLIQMVKQKKEKNPTSKHSPNLFFFFFFFFFNFLGQGAISQAEFQNVVYNLGEQMSQQDAQELMAEACGQDGYVRYRNLVDSWFSFDR
jgi:Ca2+-binding EF-hand superfamily protein